MIDLNLPKLLVTLIETNKANRRNSIRENICPEQWALEYCTVQCNHGRQTGKSHFIRMSANKNSIIIAPRRSLLHKLARNSCYAILTPDRVENALRGRNIRHIDTVYIDDSSYFNYSKWGDVKDSIAMIARISPAERTYILLG